MNPLTLLNPWVILGILAALAAAAASGYAGGTYITGLEKEKTFQAERDKWTSERDKMKTAGDLALKQAEGERDSLQKAVSEVIGPRYAALEAANQRFQRNQKEKGDSHAKLELPPDDRTCDLPAGMFDDWITNNRGPGGREGGTGVTGVGLDTTLRPAAGSLGTVAGSPGGQPPGSGRVVPRMPTPP